MTTLAAHARHLAAQLNTQLLKEFNEAEPRATSNGRRHAIYVGAVGTPSGYFTALHELGHIALNHKGGDPKLPRILAEECEAWQWAFDHAKIQPSTAVRRSIAGWIGTYLAAADYTPNPDHPVWALKNVVEPDRSVAGPKGRLP